MQLQSSGPEFTAGIPHRVSPDQTQSPPHPLQLDARQAPSFREKKRVLIGLCGLGLCSPQLFFHHNPEHHRQASPSHFLRNQLLTYTHGTTANMADAVGGAAKVNGHANGYPSSYAAKYNLAPHFIGGNALNKAPPTKVKDFVQAHDGHTVITNVRFTPKCSLSKYPSIPACVAELPAIPLTFAPRQNSAR